MIGNNKMQLCSAVVHEALAYYLNNQVLKLGHAVKVTAVNVDNKAYSAEWTVTIEPADVTSPTVSV